MAVFRAGGNQYRIAGMVSHERPVKINLELAVDYVPGMPLHAPVRFDEVMGIFHKAQLLIASSVPLETDSLHRV